MYDILLTYFCKESEVVSSPLCIICIENKFCCPALQHATTYSNLLLYDGAKKSQNWKAASRISKLQTEEDVIDTQIIFKCGHNASDSLFLAATYDLT